MYFLSMICQLHNHEQILYVLLIKSEKILSFTTLWSPSINSQDKGPSYSKTILTKNRFNPNYRAFVHAQPQHHKPPSLAKPSRTARSAQGGDTVPTAAPGAPCCPPARPSLRDAARSGTFGRTCHPETYSKSKYLGLEAACKL